MITTNEPHEPMGATDAYHRGIRDALDVLADIARHSRQLRGEAAVMEARRRLTAAPMTARNERSCSAS